MIHGQQNFVEPIQIRSRRPSHEQLPYQNGVTYELPAYNLPPPYKEATRDLYRSRSFSDFNNLNTETTHKISNDTPGAIVIRSNSKGSLQTSPAQYEPQMLSNSRVGRTSFQIPRSPTSYVYPVFEDIIKPVVANTQNDTRGYRLSPQVPLAGTYTTQSYSKPPVSFQSIIHEPQPIPNQRSEEIKTTEPCKETTVIQFVHDHLETVKPAIQQNTVTLMPQIYTPAANYSKKDDDQTNANNASIQNLRKANVQLVIENGKLTSKNKVLEKGAAEKDAKIGELKTEIERLNALVHELKDQDLCADLEEQLKWQELARQAVERVTKESEARKIAEKRCEDLSKLLEQFEGIRNLHLEGDSYVKNPFSNNSKVHGSGSSQGKENDKLKPKEVSSPNLGSEIHYFGDNPYADIEEQSQIITKKTTAYQYKEEIKKNLENHTMAYGSMNSSKINQIQNSEKVTTRPGNNGEARTIEDSYYVKSPTNAQLFNFTTAANDESTVVKGKFDGDSGLMLLDHGDSRLDATVRLESSDLQHTNQKDINEPLELLKAEIARLKKENDSLAEENCEAKRQLLRHTIKDKSSTSPNKSLTKEKPSINIEAKIKFLEMSNRFDSSHGSPAKQEKTPKLGAELNQDWVSIYAIRNNDEQTELDHEQDNRGGLKRQTFGTLREAPVKNPYDDDSDEEGAKVTNKNQLFSSFSLKIAKNNEDGNRTASEKEGNSNQTTKYSPNNFTVKFGEDKTTHGGFNDLKNAHSPLKDRESLSVQENYQYQFEGQMIGQREEQLARDRSGKKSGNLAGSEGGDIRLNNMNSLKEDSLNPNISIDSFAHVSNTGRAGVPISDTGRQESDRADIIPGGPGNMTQLFLGSGDKDSERLITLLNKRDREIDQLRDKVAYTSTQLDAILLENSHLKDSSHKKDIELTNLATRLRHLEKSKVAMREEERRQFIKQVGKFKDERDHYRRLMEEYKENVIQVKAEIASRLQFMQYGSKQQAYEDDGGEEEYMEEGEEEEGIENDENLVDDNGHEWNRPQEKEEW